MVETAVAVFGLDLAAAWRLTFRDYRMLERVARRRLKAEHERDVWLAWITAAFVHKPTSADAVRRMTGGAPRARRDDGGVALQHRLAFEAWYEQQKRAE